MQVNNRNIVEQVQQVFTFDDGKDGTRKPETAEKIRIEEVSEQEEPRRSIIEMTKGNSVSFNFQPIEHEENHEVIERTIKFHSEHPDAVYQLPDGSFFHGSVI